MSGSYTRTSEEEIEQLTYFYRLFRPNELLLVLDLNKSWSLFDSNRCESIAQLVRQIFGSNHSSGDIRAVIDFFNVKQDLRLTHDKPLKAILEENATVHLNPFISSCPLCHGQLYSINARKKYISIYCLHGEVRKGTVIHILIVVFIIIESVQYRYGVFIDM